MGSRCFSPLLHPSQPIYITSFQSSIKQAQKIINNTKQTSQNQYLLIVQNENRKGYLKKIFDHLQTHQMNINPMIKYTDRKVSRDKMFSTLVIGTMVASKIAKLVIHIKSKNQVKINDISMSKNILSTPRSSSQLKKSTSTIFQGLFYQIQMNFLNLIIKILLYNKCQQVYKQIFESLIKYCGKCDKKFSSRKQLKQLLDIFLNIIFHKDKEISKDSYIPFYTYSILLSKSHSQIINKQFIEKHFQFILKLFFQLKNMKLQNHLNHQNDWNTFQLHVEEIFKQFLTIAQDNKNIKDYILNVIIIKQDKHSFATNVTRQIYKLVQQQLNLSDREHFMFLWLDKILNYLSKGSLQQKITVQKQFPFNEVNTTSKVSNKLNFIHINDSISKRNAILTIKSWFQQKLMNIQTMLQYRSQKIFISLLVNLGNKNYLDLYSHTKDLIFYLLSKYSSQIGKLLLFLANQIRKNTDVIAIINNLMFLQQINRKSIQYSLNQQQISDILSFINKQIKNKVSFQCCLQLVALSLYWIDLKQQTNQNKIVSFLISLTFTIKKNNLLTKNNQFQQIMKHFMHNLLQKSKSLFISFVKFTEKCLIRQENQFINNILILILLNMVVQLKLGSNSSKYKRLNQLKIQFQRQNINTYKQNKLIYQNNKILQQNNKILQQKNIILQQNNKILQQNNKILYQKNKILYQKNKKWFQIDDKQFENQKIKQFQLKQLQKSEASNNFQKQQTSVISSMNIDLQNDGEFQNIVNMIQT